MLLSVVSGTAFEADSLQVASDTVAVDSIKVAKGFDASNYVNAKRWRVPGYSRFAKGAFKNFSVGLRTGMVKMMSVDYSFGQMLGVDLTKWLHPAVGLRLSGGYGSWIDNFDGVKTNMADVSASVLFNLTSYVGGFDTWRFGEFSLVGGVAYNCLWKSGGDVENVFSNLFGINFEMRLYDGLHLFLEPEIGVYYNSEEHIDTWRSYMTGFGGMMGLSYVFGQEKSLRARLNKYFISVWGGFQIQNSAMVLKKMGKREMIGFQGGLGYGRWYNDWFAMRFSASYSRNAWLKYAIGELKYTQYYNLRLEGMFNLLGMWENKLSERMELSALVGPEFGRMIKEDRNYRISEHYIGLTGGVNASLKVHKYLSLFAEPRISVVPYSALSSDLDSPSENRNYFDCLLGVNVGINILIP